MGNGLTSENSRLRAVSHHEQHIQAETMKPVTRRSGHHHRGEKMKTVKFRIREEEGNDHKEDEHGSSSSGDQCKEGAGGGSGRVRIRVVVTKEELKEILMMSSHKKDCNNRYSSSVEQLIKAVKLRDRIRRSMLMETSDDSTWKPSLESIPEDH